ncbi:hypothetical protein GALMADRAFT_104893 [Galerina marginata CBS 339.88]|uniref:Uncharacterized protein n=1 Tax=Galerina marginata (strain CBS 339.88) TaxID=685588 RepID=A0A067SED1_GALM3|nr:hypothetical protein GALMADRAFT_104893 [Galerina marginata CBS 339.88]
MYGPIFNFYRGLGASDGCFGRPITSVTDLPDGSKCCITEGGHIHSLGEIAEPFPAEHCIAQYKPVAPTNPFGLRPGGLVCTINNNSLPYVVYGNIYNLWRALGHVDSGWGRPLTDEQGLEDGGRCSVFEGGHIHCYASIARGYPAEQCTAKYKPTTRALVFNQMVRLFDSRIFSLFIRVRQPPHFQRKWSQLALQTQPLAQKSVAELLGEPWHRLGDNPNKPGQYFHFMSGLLVSLDNNPNPAPMQISQQPMNSPQYGGPPGSPQMTQTYGNQGPPGAPSGGPPMYELPNMAHQGQQDSKSPPLETIPPFALYRTIYDFFRSEGDLGGKYGRPLCDEQDLGDGGRCSIFEGGHIHMYNGVARGAPAETCTAPYQPRAPPPPASSVSPNANYQSSGATHHQANWGSGSGYGGGGAGYDYNSSQANYQPTPQPQIHGGGGQGQSGQQQETQEVQPGGFWYCLTGIDLNKAPEEPGPWCVYASTGLLPGQHSGYCCHGCCWVTM